MKYLGYLIIIGAVALGYFKLPVFTVLILALLGTFIFARSRRSITRGDLLKPNPLAEGAYLFFGQALILFTAYLLGHFAATEAGSEFWQFITGSR